MEGMDITGIVDLYDEDTNSLIDYKNAGSYKVAQVLGLDFYLEDDPSGAVYLRNGKWGKKGEPKKVKRYWANPEKADLGDWEWQINCYRYMHYLDLPKELVCSNQWFCRIPQALYGPDPCYPNYDLHLSCCPVVD